MDSNYFPRNAFLPAKTFGHKIAELFNARSFDQSDLRSIRTSVYYSNFEIVEQKMRYVIAVGHALRDNDGRFIVYTSQSQITEDPVRGSICINAGYQDDASDTTLICDEKDVIRRMKELARVLDQKCDYSLAFPKNVPLRLCDDLHIHQAELVANAPRTAQEIIHYQRSTKLNDRHQPSGTRFTLP
jgi:hypothetical protein